MKYSPTTEERIWSILSHLSAIAFGMGILLPVIGWSEQRRKSNYAAFQCLQALGYQSLGYTTWILVSLLVVIALMFVTISKLAAASGRDEDITFLLGPSLTIHFVIAMALIGLYAIFPVLAAISCARGKEFYYPIIGNHLARYLGYGRVDDQEWLIEEREDRWVAAMGHFSVIIALWGILAPLTAWILQSKRSLFLRLQSIQTLIYQAGVTILFFSAGFVYLFGLGIFVGTIGFGGEPNLNNSTAMVGLIVFVIFMLIAFVIILIVPLFHIMGQWAGYRVLKGDNYYYPVLGRLVEKTISRKTSLPESTPPRTAV